MLSIEGFRFRIGTFDAPLEPTSRYLIWVRTHSLPGTVGRPAKRLRSPGRREPVYRLSVPLRISTATDDFRSVVTAGGVMPPGLRVDPLVQAEADAGRMFCLR
jgi:hypothetical protein